MNYISFSNNYIRHDAHFELLVESMKSLNTLITENNQLERARVEEECETKSYKIQDYFIMFPDLLVPIHWNHHGRIVCVFIPELLNGVW